MRAIIQAVQPWAASLAILTGALIVGGVMLRAQLIDRYEISANTDGGVWRANLRTGDVQLCAVLKGESLFDKFDPDGPKARVVCRGVFRSSDSEK